MQKVRELGRRQDVLLLGAAFVVMTEEETVEYNRLAARIADLVRQLTATYPKMDCGLGPHQAQESDEAARNLHSDRRRS